MKKLLYLPVFLAFFVSCCSMPSPGKADYLNSRRAELLPDAIQGQADAQYELGNSYCCSSGGGGFLSTKEAAKWWCKAAEQGHPQAKNKLQQQGISCQEQSRK